MLYPYYNVLFIVKQVVIFLILYADGVSSVLLLS